MFIGKKSSHYNLINISDTNIMLIIFMVMKTGAFEVVVDGWVPVPGVVGG
jgi:hypothetical protein